MLTGLNMLTASYMLVALQSLDWATYEIIQSQPLSALAQRASDPRSSPPLAVDDPWFVATKKVRVQLQLRVDS